jgi:queuine tRNA-ribosyltransferase
MFRIIHKDGNSRVGKLRTLHGTVETPVFLPVATKATAKHLSPKELTEAGSHAVICNSFLLSLRPGISTITKSGGLHKFMGWENAIFTDSGGFQLLSEPFFQKTNDKGGYIKSPFDGKTHFLSPEMAVEIQQSIGSDVMMCLDEMPLYTQGRLQVASATRRTHGWAKRCLAARTSAKQLLFGIVQGGVYKDLRKKSTQFIASLDFDGISIGGLAVGEPKKKMHEMLKVSLPLLPRHKPRYLMGVGSPPELLESISMGVDIFDSAFPTQNARHGTLFTFHGNMKITNLQYREDAKPVEQGCPCYLCTNFSRAYLHHLFRMNEPLGLRLASLHNIFFLNRLLRETKAAIKESGLKKFKKRFKLLLRKQ